MFKVIFNYIRSSKLAWDTHDFVSETKQKKKRQTKDKDWATFWKIKFNLKGICVWELWYDVLWDTVAGR